ncbi:MAG: cytochrome c3 family protein [Planctomycetes bacterium]|nr:cytochrome c3 family protein [Planctomycetota bacterium]
MAQIFHKSFNSLSKVSIVVGGLVAATALTLVATANTTSWITYVGVAREQTPPFSHKHHVAGLGIDCRYCHTTVEEAGFAGIPATKTCMTCHSQVWTEAPILEPVRESYRTDKPLEWVRVHDLPDFVYFDHSIHVAKGVGCSTCHGQVDQMPLMWRENTLNMTWCLSCHRDPAQFVRPKDKVFDMTWTPPANQREQGEALVRDYHITSKTNCGVCHR